MKKLFESLLIFLLIIAFSGKLFSNTIESAYKNFYDNLINMNSATISLSDTSEVRAQELNVNILKAKSAEYVFVPEEMRESTLKVFPNPASDKLYIRFHGWDGEKEIKILDITGRSVYLLKSAEENLEIDISTLPKGIYLIHVKNKLQYVVNKIKIN